MTANPYESPKTISRARARQRSPWEGPLVSCGVLGLFATLAAPLVDEILDPRWPTEEQVMVVGSFVATVCLGLAFACFRARRQT